LKNDIPPTNNAAQKQNPRSSIPADSKRVGKWYARRRYHRLLKALVWYLNMSQWAMSMLRCFEPCRSWGLPCPLPCITVLMLLHAPKLPANGLILPKIRVLSSQVASLSHQARHQNECVEMLWLPHVLLAAACIIVCAYVGQSVENLPGWPAVTALTACAFYCAILLRGLFEVSVRL
jgi:hypothetical protein